MDIRQYTKQHRDSCIKVFDSNVGKYFSPSEREEFIEYLDSFNERCDYYVYIRDARVVACGGVGINSTIASLTWGMVHRDFHGQGIGTVLTDYRLSQLHSNPAIEVIKIETSQHTEGFYRKRGFITTHVIKDGFGQGIDCVSMELKVVPSPVS
ncbi:GNAT family N-acetyltransferase [Photobacterium kasasachensis]|uniref:GNAT family N-acetyltransferase n=1 Tax=Photobacterium kasasachensis TaxID=2910240 RepID=UPI003D13F4B7